MPAKAFRVPKLFKWLTVGVRRGKGTKGVFTVVVDVEHSEAEAKAAAHRCVQKSSESFVVVVDFCEVNEQEGLSSFFVCERIPFLAKR